MRSNCRHTCTSDSQATRVWVVIVSSDCERVRSVQFPNLLALFDVVSNKFIFKTCNCSQSLNHVPKSPSCLAFSLAAFVGILRHHRQTAAATSNIQRCRLIVSLLYQCAQLGSAVSRAWCSIHLTRCSSHSACHVFVRSVITTVLLLRRPSK